MVKINSTSRLFSITSEVILTQTDTTAGFLSQDEKRLQIIKQRPSDKHFIKVYKTFYALKKENIRVPSSQKALIRRAVKSTFIVKNRAFRVVKDHLDSTLLASREWNYSSSANESGKKFERAFCEEKADIIIENQNVLYEGTSSALYKINNKQRVRLR
jgi:tRNA A37 threonylcarbamoyladenosine synthetase subunit TsaC/SUA5/YrdC